MNDGQQNKHPQEEEIDLLELALKVWAERKWILKCCGYAVIVGLVIAFSIPKEYTTSVMIAPDEKDVEGFDEFIKQYQKGLALERVAIDVM